MFCITIALKDTPAPWTLLYKDEALAQADWDNYKNNPAENISLGDDFGQVAQVNRACVAGAMFEDLDKSMLAHIERGLHNARTQAKAQQIAMNDPVLKTAAMTRGQGPGIFDPQANGRMQG